MKDTFRRILFGITMIVFYTTAFIGFVDFTFYDGHFVVAVSDLVIAVMAHIQFTEEGSS